MALLPNNLPLLFNNQALIPNNPRLLQNTPKVLENIPEVLEITPKENIFSPNKKNNAHVERYFFMKASFLSLNYYFTSVLNIQPLTRSLYTTTL